MLARLARKSTSTNRVAFQRWFASFPPHEILPMAALSPTMEFGGVARWVKQEGESIIAGDIVAEIETDKATIDFEAQDDSFLAKILVPSGTSDVPVGTPLAITVEEESDIAAFANATSADFGMETAGPPPTTEAPPTATPPPPTPVAAAPVPAAPVSVAVAASSGGRVFASPAARRVARENGISVNSVGSGSGPNGRIITMDVESFLLSGGSSRESMGAGVDFAHTATRHSIAERLTRAKQEVPHYYLTVDVDLTEVMRMRDQLKKERSMNISVHDFVLKASASAMSKVPDVNASWMDSFIRQFAYVDVNVAVNTERGLVMPIVKNLQSTSLLDLSKAVAEAAEGARNGTLSEDGYATGTFSVVNVGSYGVRSSEAIVVPPQACVLSVGAVERRVVVDDADAWRAAPIMSATLSCDHRVIDGAVGAQWLQEFKAVMQSPVSMLI